jgi:hypothetical protein
MLEKVGSMMELLKELLRCVIPNPAWSGTGLWIVVSRGILLMIHLENV